MANLDSTCAVDETPLSETRPPPLNDVRGQSLYIVSAVFVAVNLLHTFMAQDAAPGLTAARIAGIVALAIFIACPAFYYFTGRRRLAAAVLIVTTFFVVIYTTLNNGGVPAPTLPFLTILPLAATIIISRIAGIVSAVVVLCAVGFLLFATNQGIAVPSPHHVGELRVLFASSIVLTAIAITLVALSYEKLAQSTLRQLSDTHRRLMVDAHKLSENQIFIKTVLDTMQDGIVAADKDGRLTYLNRAAREFHGFGVDTVTPEQRRNAFKLFEQDGKTPLLIEDAPLHQAIYGDTENNQELVIAPRNQSPRLMEVQARSLFNNQRSKIGAVATWRDITSERSQANEILALKERYEIAMQSANIGLWEYDIAKEELYWSDLIHDILGSDRDSHGTFGSFIENRLHPDDKDEVQNALYLSATEDAQISIVFRLRCESGSYAFVRARGKTVYSEAGLPLRISGSFVDVTEEENAESLRRLVWQVLTEQGIDADQKLQYILSRTTEYYGLRVGMIARIDGDAYDVIHAYSPEEEVKPGHTATISGAYCAHVIGSGALQAFHNVEESEIRSLPCDFNFMRGAYIGIPLIVDGKMYGTLNFSSPTPRDKPFSTSDFQLIELIAQWVGFEIGRKLNLQSLRQSEERFSLAADGASVGIWDWKDVTGSEEHWSDQFYRLLGYEPGEIEASLDAFKDIIHEEDHEQTFSAVERHFNAGEPFRVEYRLRCKDGSFRWFLGTGQAVWDDIGNPRRMIGSIMDIHERKKAETLKSEFVSTVSHELRTPMTSIMGAIGLVQSGAFGDMGPKATDLLKMASTNGERLVRLINDILDIEKIEAGKVEFQKIPINVSDLIRDAVTQNETFAVGHNARIESVDECNGAMTLGDPDRLMQVLTNLISNAAKFTGENGLIQVRARRDGGGIRISITDNGPGIAQDKLQSIFEKFTQLDARDSRANAGTGLGLSISKAIVDAHDGELSVQSHDGVGTTFSIVLDEKVEEENGSRTVAFDEITGVYSGRKRILHAEDDRDTAALLEHMVGDIADVKISPTVASARSNLENFEYDLVVLDMTLPDQRGEKVLEYMAEMQAPPPVIIYSVEDLSDRRWPNFVIGAFVKSRIPQKVLYDKIKDVLGMTLKEAAGL